jgi:hypothetical protein
MQIAIRGIKRKYKCAVHQALLKMPRSDRRITGKGAESPKMTQSPVLSGKAIPGPFTRPEGYSKSPGFISASSASTEVSGERSWSGVSGGKGESFGGALACLSRRTGCSSQFIRRALKGGKLW